jgi:acetylornithine deacetylase/succinyl-diaminopimelate desuccinylase-like protein
MTLRPTDRLRADIAALRPRFEDELAELVNIPSVSVEPERKADVRRCGERAAEYVRAAGGTAELIETGGHPLVLGRFGHDPARPTVTVYNHLDVQPADPAGWKSPPFTFSRDPSDEDVWRARGTTDDKGPALAALHGARLAVEDGAPINIQLLWELEEEIGSPNFEAGLGEAIAAGLRTDSVVVSDTIWVAADRPAIPYGLRGNLGFTISLQTGAKDVHSGTTGGAARNPLGELAALISRLYDAKTGVVKIPGFYADVRKPSAAEQKGLAASGFSGKRFKAAHELRSLRFTDDTRLREAITVRPTLEVHGLVGGYRGPGIKTIVPHAGEAKLSCRLVPDQDPKKILAAIKAFVKRHCPDAVVKHEGTLPPYLADIGGPYHEAAVAAMREAFGKQPALTREGGSIGAVLTMRKRLGAPVLFLGLSLPEHGYHAINENFDWRQARGGVEMFYRYFFHLGALPPGRVAASPSRARIKKS